MNETDQSQSDKNQEQECCDLYEEYCYPCNADSPNTTENNTTSEKTD